MADKCTQAEIASNDSKTTQTVYSFKERDTVLHIINGVSDICDDNVGLESDLEKFTSKAQFSRKLSNLHNFVQLFLGQSGENSEMQICIELAGTLRHRQFRALFHYYQHSIYLQIPKWSFSRVLLQILCWCHSLSS